MKVSKLFGMAVGFGIALAQAQTSQIDVAISQLRRSHPAATWRAKSAIIADVTCDGRTDIVILGAEKGNVLVAVVPGGQSNKAQVLEFPLSRSQQDGFCAVPSRITTAPLSCEISGGSLDGCKTVKGCQEFAIDNNGCDPFNFYWDSSRHTIQWWRE